MTGTIINFISIIAGGLIGMIFGGKLPDRVRQTVMAVLGLFTLGLGFQLFLKTGNSLVVLAALLVGTILGEWWRIEERLENLGEALKTRFALLFSKQDHSRFVEGFLTASLLFSIGPMAILGSIQDGLTGDYTLLATKAIMDGFASLAFASTMGAGVIFSAFIVLALQGGITLLAIQIQNLTTLAMINEMSAAGGVILIGIALSNILNVVKVRTGSFLPALFLAPLFAAIAVLLELL